MTKPNSPNVKLLRRQFRPQSRLLAHKSHPHLQIETWQTLFNAQLQTRAHRRPTRPENRHRRRLLLRRRTVSISNSVTSCKYYIQLPVNFCAARCTYKSLSLFLSHPCMPRIVQIVCSKQLDIVTSRQIRNHPHRQTTPIIIRVIGALESCGVEILSD